MYNIDSQGRYTARIGVYAVIEKDNKILLAQRISGYMNGYYAFPSGHVEKDERLIDTLIRETREEIGIEIDEKDIEFDYVCYKVSYTYYVCFFFKIKKWIGEPQIMEKEKCGDLRFFDLDKLPKNLAIEEKNYFEDRKNYKKFRDKL
jgi:mutator protein MutT